MASAELVAEARCPGTPPDRLRELADRGPRLARIVACRIGLPPETAEELAVLAAERGPEWLGVLRALAAQPATSGARLAALAVHPDASVRRAAAVHPETPESALGKLARDAATPVRRALAGRETLPPGIAGGLLADASGDVRLTMARRFDAGPEELRPLAADPDPRVRRVVTALGFGNGGELTDPDPAVRRTAVRTRDHTRLAHILPELARDPDRQIRDMVTEMHRNHDPAALAVLATDPEAAVRAGAAGNWFTPVRSLTELANDPDPRVAEALTGNHLAPPDALARLADRLIRLRADDIRTAGAGHEVHRVVHDLLGHPATPPGTLRRLHELGPSHFHEGNAIGAPNWPPHLVARFALQYSSSVLDGDEERASHAAIHEALRTRPPEEVLAAMADSPVHWLAAVIANRHVPREVLARCAAEADRGERTDHLDDLAANPSLPEEYQLAWAAAGRRCHDLLRNPELPGSVLELLADGPDDHRAERARLILEVRAHRAGAETPC
jgi:hypothetical protein